MIGHYVLNFLNQISSLAPLVGNRISMYTSNYNDHYITFKILNTDEELDAGNNPSVNKCRVQVDCYSTNNARKMSNAISKAWNGNEIHPFQRIIKESDNSFYEKETNLERIILVFSFYFTGDL